MGREGEPKSIWGKELTRRQAIASGLTIGGGLFLFVIGEYLYRRGLLPQMEPIKPNPTQIPSPTEPNPTPRPEETPTPSFFNFESLECFHPEASLEEKWGSKEDAWLFIESTRETVLKDPALKLLEKIKHPPVPLGVIVPEHKKVSFGSLPILKMETLEGNQFPIVWAPPLLLSNLKFTPSKKENIKQTHLPAIFSEYAKVWGLKKEQVDLIQDPERVMRINLECQNLELHQLPVTYFVDQEGKKAGQFPFPTTEEGQSIAIKTRDQISGQAVSFLLSPGDSQFLHQLTTIPESKLSEENKILKRNLFEKPQMINIEMSQPYRVDSTTGKWQAAEMKVVLPDVLEEKVLGVKAKFVLKALVVVGNPKS